jgi:hypothetical protein
MVVLELTEIDKELTALSLDDELTLEAYEELIHARDRVRALLTILNPDYEELAANGAF